MTIDKHNILEIQNLVIHYETHEGTVEAVNGIDFKLPFRKTLGIVGETGAGKTTMALSILRLVSPRTGVIKNGRIILDGRDILMLSEKEMRKVRGKEVAMVFQDPMTSLNPVHTVRKQISEVVKYHENLSEAEANKVAEQMLEIVGIPGERGNEYPHQFSGGMKQRVVIAIALACRPKVLIADEPTTALDVTIQAQVLELMKDLKRKLQMSIIMITHDLGIVAETCDDVAVMYAGNIIEYGEVKDVFREFLHPYTEGLFNSLPIINKRNQRIIPIPGLMPNPMNLGAGCPFAPRCPYVFEKCSIEKPKLKDFGKSHIVACHRYEQEGFKLKRGRI